MTTQSNFILLNRLLTNDKWVRPILLHVEPRVARPFAAKFKFRALEVARDQPRRVKSTA